MSKEELESLLDVVCCEYHNEVCKKANREIIKLKEEIDELKRDIEILTDDDDNDSVWMEEYNR